MHQALMIKTADGVMPVERFGLPGPTGIIVYMDGFGVRDELREICLRHSRTGHVAYLPNLYYRHGGPSFDPPNVAGSTPPEEAQRLNRATTVEMSVSDIGTLIRSERLKALAAVGYCMGGRHAIATAATYPDVIRACLSIHGGQMIWDGEWSCERLIPKVRAELFLAFAKNDPACSDSDKAQLRAAMMEPGVTGVARDYDAAHGWSFPQRHCHDKSASEDVWHVADDMFARTLAP